MSKLEELIKKLCPNGVVYYTIGEIANYRRGSFPQPYTNSAFYDGDGAMPFVQVADIENNGFKLKDYTKQTISKIAQSKSIFVSQGTVICSIQGTIGRVAITQYDAYVDRTIAIFEEYKININKRFFAYCIQLKFGIEKNFARGSTLKTITKEEFTKFKIPVPPIEVQNEIVRILDNFIELESELESELEVRKEQYNYYFYKLMNSNQYKKIKLSEIGKVKMCKRILKNQTTPEGDIPFYKIGTFGKKADAYISEETFKELKNKYSYPKKGDILISCSGTIGRTVVFDGKPAYFQDSNIVWLEHDETIIKNSFLKYCYRMSPWKIATGGTIARLYNDNILNAEVLVPPLKEQQRIVSILDRFDKLCNDISEGLPAEIEARRKQYEYYRDKLLNFKELKVENKE